ncbi:MAG: hypothetical protein AAF840_15535 [Bacteroidota bacterium]
MIALLGQSLSVAPALPALTPAVQEVIPFSPEGLLRYLEEFYALGVPDINRTALRTEQYRQVVQLHLEQSSSLPFYAASFTADQPATAAELLSRRDELLAAGYRLNGPPPPDCPDRIIVLHQLEEILLTEEYNLQLLPGVADRLNLLLAALEEDRHPRMEILLNEPRSLLSVGTQRLLSALEKIGDKVLPLPAPKLPSGKTDLERWQCYLLGQMTTEQLSLAGDGSLLLLRAERDTHLAAYLARMLRDNPSWRPGLLLPLRNHTLDNALLAEGLPSLGVPATSLARPSLQVLKLITAFLWKPIEIERVMEFVSLVTKPLHWRLGQRIAEYLSDTPGMFGPKWNSMLNRFFSEMEDERKWPQSRLDATRHE